MEGTYAVRIDGPLRVVRADGRVEEVPPGTETIARAGDAVVFPVNEAPQSAANPGSTPLVVLDAGIYSTVPPAIPSSGPPPAGIEVEGLGFLSEREWAQVPPGPLAVTLRRLTLAPGAALPPRPVDPSAPELLFVSEGELAWSAVRPGEAATPAGALRFRAGEAVPATELPPGSLLALSNGGDEPLVLLSLAIAPAAASATPEARENT